MINAPTKRLGTCKNTKVPSNPKEKQINNTYSRQCVNGNYWGIVKRKLNGKGTRTVYISLKLRPKGFINRLTKDTTKRK